MWQEVFVQQQAKAQEKNAAEEAAKEAEQKSKSEKRGRDVLKGPGGAVTVVAAQRPDTYHEAWNKDLKVKGANSNTDANGNGDNSNTTVASSSALGASASANSASVDEEVPEGVTPKVVKKKKLSHVEQPGTGMIVPVAAPVAQPAAKRASASAERIVDPDVTPADG